MLCPLPDPEPLQQLLAEKLALPPSAFERLWPSVAAPWADAAARDPRAACGELAAGLDALLCVLTPHEAGRLLQAQPALLVAPLASWCGFFDAMSFSRAEQKAMITQCPEVRAHISAGRRTHCSGAHGLRPSKLICDSLLPRLVFTIEAAE
jgi:hypothetical protein